MGRISTAQMFRSQLDALKKQQEKVFELQRQAVEGNKFNRPSDDVVASARANSVSSYLGHLKTYDKNLAAADHQLRIQQDALSAASNSLVRVKELSVQAGSGILNQNDRDVIANELSQMRDTILSLANSRDENGNYIFSGSQVDTPAYAQVSGSYVFQGNAYNKELNVAPNRNVTVSQSGQGIFGNSADNVFNQLQSMIDALGNNDMTAFQTASTAVDGFANNVIQATARSGTQSAMVEKEGDIMGELVLQNETTLTDLTGADLIEVISKLSQQTTAYEISLKTFGQLQQNSLFNVLFG